MSFLDKNRKRWASIVLVLAALFGGAYFLKHSSSIPPAPSPREVAQKIEPPPSEIKELAEEPKEEAPLPVLSTPEIKEPAPVQSESKPAKKREHTQVQTPIAPTPEPTPVECSNENTEGEIRWLNQVYAGASLSRVSLSASDQGSSAKASLVSNSRFDFSLGWEQRWSESVHTQLGASIGFLSFTPSNNPLKQVDTATKILGSAQFRFLYREKNLWEAGVAFGYASQLFARGVASTFVTAESTLLPKIELDARYALSDTLDNGFVLSGGIAALMPGNTGVYAINAGGQAHAIISYKFNITPKLQAEVQAGTSYRVQSTSILSHRQLDLISSFRIVLPLGRIKD